MIEGKKYTMNFSAMNNLRLAYITTCFPTLSETFVYREVDTLLQRGVHVHPFSVKRPRVPMPDAAHLTRRTTYLWPVRPWRFLVAHVRFIFRRPWRYLRILRLSQHGDRSWRAGLRAWLHVQEAVYFADFCRRRNITHIHAQFAHGPATVAWLAAELLAIPFSFTAHANDIFADPLMLSAKIKAARFVATISDFNRRYLSQFVDRQAAAKIEVIRCGVPEDFFASEIRRRSAVGRILAVGRLVEKKGFRHLIVACQVLNVWGVPFECHIIGEGPERRTLEGLMAQYGLEDQVKLLGARSQREVRRRLKSADLFVLPCVQDATGDRDGIPVSLMEAMAAGVPCVSTRISGVPELIDDGRNGRLVESANPYALAVALRELLRDESLRRAYAADARQTVRQRFYLDTEVERLLRCFLPGEQEHTEGLTDSEHSPRAPEDELRVGVMN